jgi:excisionase family DNA binding protein
LADQHDLFTPEEVAAYLRVNPQTIYRLLRVGKLPGAKIGHQWRIRRADLDAYLRGATARQGEPPKPALTAQE